MLSYSLNLQFKQYISLLLNRYPVLFPIADAIIDAYLLMEKGYDKGGKLLIAGNGGSASDADHIVGELMKSFKSPRLLDSSFIKELIAVDKVRGREIASKLQGGLPAIALHNHQSLNTAFLNDVDGLYCFAQQVYCYGEKNDVFLGITTSGNSKNVINAAVVAKAMGLKVIGLTGEKGGQISEIADITVRVPKEDTYMVQELHLPVYHCWCLMLEERFFGKTEKSLQGV